VAAVHVRVTWTLPDEETCTSVGGVCEHSDPGGAAEGVPDVTAESTDQHEPSLADTT
jgi:hypothetical protein